MKGMPLGAGGYAWDHKMRRLPRSEPSLRFRTNSEGRAKAKQAGERKKALTDRNRKKKRSGRG